MRGLTRNKQADAGRHFQKAGEIPEPLAEADFVEHFDHHRDTGQFGAAGSYKGQGGKAGKDPEGDQAALDGGGWQFACRYHEILLSIQQELRSTSTLMPI